MELNFYEIIQEIGEGAFSKVFKVSHKPTGDLFAMKVIEYDRLSAKQREYAQEEINIMKNTKNPHIISYQNSFFHDQKLYIVMELAENGDLQHKIDELQEKELEFPIETVWKYFYQILIGLKALHDQNTLHRDIKPANIFIMQNGNVKIGDFNVGKENVRNLVLTRIGTPLIMSPEVLLGKEYNYKTDIWSLGCVVFEMATLRKPYEADFEVALYQKVKKMKIELPRHRNLEKILKKMLSHKPARRPACADILAEEEFRRFLPEFQRKKSVERKVSISFRAPSLVNISINKDLSSRRNLHESPSGRKLRHYSQKNLKAISCERQKFLHKGSTDILSQKSNISPTSPNNRTCSKSKILKDYSIKIYEMDQPNDQRKKERYVLDAKKSFAKAINFSNKLNAQGDKQIKLRYGPSEGQLTAMSAPRLKKAIGVYLNDLYIVKGRNKKNRPSVNTLNTLSTPKAGMKQGININPLLQFKSK